MNLKYKPVEVGHRYGRLLVIAKATSITAAGGRTRTRWKCICDCGTVYIARSDRLRCGELGSCGCMMRQPRHGDTRGNKIAPEYRVWEEMRARCYNPKHISYKHYGGRGITVCERWHKYENFLEDVGRKPTPKHSIDRIDNNGNYEPNNVRWANDYQQQRNRTDNRRIEYRGETKTLAEWAEILNVPSSRLQHRLQKYGWTVERAFSEPSRQGTTSRKR